LESKNNIFIKKAKYVHGDTYDYSSVEYKKAKEKVIIVCKDHGNFIQSPNKHLNGQGCPKCGKLSTKNKQSLGSNIFIVKAKEIHGNKYDYSKVEYINNRTKVIIICPIHGDFEQTPKEHLKGSGCSKCGENSRVAKRKDTAESFVKKARFKHKDRYTYEEVKYVDSKTKIIITCPDHGEYEQLPTNHLKGHGCFKCNCLGFSKKEKELHDFVNILIYSKSSVRNLINSKELDIYIPSKNIAIEFNGLYWHSDQFKKDTYHINKTKKCQEKGVQLIHIFEDEWDNKQEIVKSRLKNILGITENRIFARKTEIKEISSNQSIQFLDKNHIQGKVGGKVKLGLYYENKLVSLMTFGKLRKSLGSDHKKGHYELLRFCNKLNTTVVGGASKLLKHFQKNYEYKEIISYCDLRWSKGNLYKQLGFTEMHRSRPNYFYLDNSCNKRLSRFKYRKSELVKQGFNKNKTERQIMQERGFYRIYDCGTIKYKI